MAFFSRAEISLDLGCLGETDVVVTYLDSDGDEGEDTITVEQILLQVGSRLVNITQIVSDEVVEQIAHVIAGTSEDEDEPESTDADDLLEEISNLGGYDATQTNAESE